MPRYIDGSGHFVTKRDDGTWWCGTQLHNFDHIGIHPHGVIPPAEVRPFVETWACVSSLGSRCKTIHRSERSANRHAVKLNWLASVGYAPRVPNAQPVDEKWQIEQRTGGGDDGIS